ncbi:hypothetical protein [Desulfuromonas acetoxidans]|uniref:hypothetical protein n=1 Tax=Desulfuromonas acetoxidans TaxID=891 RepID=UPI00292CF2CE|nr:hypothetical protein [Desulfuromonas acetoxidans]
MKSPRLQVLNRIRHDHPRHTPNLPDLFERMGCTTLGNLPFANGDVTAGSESELQAVVVGAASQVDLPQTIEQSRFFANMIKRTQSGDTPEKQVEALREFISDQGQQVWENSWVRFNRSVLSRYAQQVLERDFLADKSHPELGNRSDLHRFCFTDEQGEQKLRLPLSYLVKLSLADLIGIQPYLHQDLRVTAEGLLNHYLNDNTSPETFSFHVVGLTADNGQGKALAHETAKRFLLTQLLTEYANEQFGLTASGQQAQIYCAPHPPQRQKQLNEMIPDAFYRELYMSPCLSGWDKGEEKHQYMHLCHQVLSRSQLNAVAKLREAGIITNNLVVLPNMSNISLANNGSHISLGSRRLTAHMKGERGLFGADEEKYCGDLAIKIQEHFLPLFAANFSAAPYRLGFEDFHPEKALGFLAHELDFTHLRMLWRRWRKKSSLNLISHSRTPFGPEWIDRPLSRLFGLKGDFVPDFRLVDYPVGFLSSDESPALNGVAGNQERLRHDLDAMGVFDARMSLYQFFKMREFNTMGFSGFEGRHYSLFAGFEQDMGAATTLQTLITALAFKYMAEGRYDHRHIPDNPGVESERRQIFFGHALGLPTFFVKRTTRNRFLLRILRKTKQIRNSRRYPGYLRVYQKEYCRALIEVLSEDGADLIEQMGCQELMADLRRRIECPDEFSVSGRLTADIMSTLGTNQPLQVPAAEFNRAAEEFYRTTLRRRHVDEALELLRHELPRLQQLAPQSDTVRSTLKMVCGQRSLTNAYDQLMDAARHQNLHGVSLLRLINLVLLSIHVDQQAAQTPSQEESFYNNASDTPVYRAS